MVSYCVYKRLAGVGFSFNWQDILWVVCYVLFQTNLDTLFLVYHLLGYLMSLQMVLPQPDVPSFHFLSLSHVNSNRISSRLPPPDIKTELC